MFTIGISGASGSGKSTLATEIADALAARTLILTLDMYYRDYPDLPFAERAAQNYDAPDAFEFEALLEDLDRLAAGHPIRLKSYDYVNHRRNPPGEEAAPPEVVVLEGIHVFHDARVRRKLDLRIFVQVDPDVCILRRLQRDTTERGRSVDSVVHQYLETVKPMYERFIRNDAEYADIVVPRGGMNPHAIEMISSYVRRRI
jgi:uridine kinase